jgi:Tfp pilus assembly protein PilZ
MSEHEGRSRRETFRQDEVLAIKEELLTPEQLDAEMNKTGIVSQHAHLMQELVNRDAGLDHYSTMSPEISGALEALDLKLNYLITMQMEQTDDAEYDQRLVNLSSTGIGFSTQKKCNKGDHLKIMVNLPLFPPVKLELIGKVVSVSSKSGNRSGTWIGISFIYRCEQEEDTIIKYLFKRQRESIRAKYTHKSACKENQDEIQPGI